MEMISIKTKHADLEIREENACKDIKIDIAHNELLPIDRQHLEIKDKFKSEPEDPVSHDGTSFEYDSSLAHISLITDMQIQTDDTPYKYFEYNSYCMKTDGLIDCKRIPKSEKSCECLGSDSSKSAIKTIMFFDEPAHLEITKEMALDESDVDIKIDIIRNETNNRKQLEIKNESKTGYKRYHTSFKRDVYKCLQCDSTFRQNGSLKNHKLVHTGEKPYKCFDCESSFRTKHSLNKHKLIHAAEKPHKCLQCESSFRQLSHLNRHKLIHTGEKPYKCLECDSSFREKPGLNKHKLIHASEKPHKCLQCESSFRQKSHLNRHKLIHTDEKPYKCLQCDSSFRENGHLNRHNLIHTVEKPYKCLKCDYSFREKHKLNKHKLFHAAE